MGAAFLQKVYRHLLVQRFSHVGQVSAFFPKGEFTAAVCTTKAELTLMYRVSADRAASYAYLIMIGSCRDGRNCSYCRAHKENGKELKAPAASVYKKVIDAMEREHRKEEKMYSAIQQGAGRKAIEEVRADSSMQMKTILAELNMEQFRRVPLYESYMADEITEEQYRAEVLDYEEAHRKLNEQLTTIMENTMVWERALSLRNPWIQQMEQYKTPDALDRNFVKKYIEQVVVTFLGDRQAEISLTMKTEEWKQMLERIELEGTDDGTKK